MYNITCFISREDFLSQAKSYRRFYNLKRVNFSKGCKAPWLIAQHDDANTHVATLFESIGVVEVDKLVRTLITGGQPLPVLPAYCDREHRRHRCYLTIPEALDLPLLSPRHR